MARIGETPIDITTVVSSKLAHDPVTVMNNVATQLNEGAGSGPLSPAQEEIMKTVKSWAAQSRPTGAYPAAKPKPVTS